MTVAVKCEDLRRSFGSIRAVDGIDLTLERGDIFALVGPDGAGKTTLIRMLVCAIRSDGGSAQVLGLDIVRDTERVKTRIGYMPQRFSLYGDLSVDENLAFYANLYGMPPSAIGPRATGLLEQFDLEPFRNRLTRDLSGGMKQKAALACTLIHGPEVLFLDEPTAGVDPVSRRQFWRMLYDLNRNGITVFVSTPYMDEAERASQVGLIYGGRLVACDAPDRLLAEVHGQIWELSATPRREVPPMLRGHPMVRRVDMFGDSFHVLVSGPGAPSQVESALRAALAPAIRVTALRLIDPSLEDVFVSVLGQRP